MNGEFPVENAGIEQHPTLVDACLASGVSTEDVVALAV